MNNFEHHGKLHFGIGFHIMKYLIFFTQTLMNIAAFSSVKQIFFVIYDFILVILHLYSANNMILFFILSLRLYDRFWITPVLSRICIYQLTWRPLDLKTN